MKLILAIAFVAANAVVQVVGHGALYGPPGRSSMWRFGFDNPINYDDNQLYCGGAGIQWNTNGGKCGFCGDDFSKPTPRPNENGGTYGKGVISRTYKSGEVIDVLIHLTTAHKGDFTFQLCNLDNGRETEECYKPLKMANGADKFEDITTSMDYNLKVQLPQGLTCHQCSFRWHYRTGNSYGDCGDGTWATGCGPQETFRGCSDIAIQ